MEPNLVDQMWMRVDQLEIRVEELQASMTNLRKLFFALEERVEKLERIHESTLKIINDAARLAGPYG